MRLSGAHLVGLGRNVAGNVDNILQVGPLKMKLIYVYVVIDMLSIIAQFIQLQLNTVN